ncbi:MAG: hypothetical protein U1F76_30965 [Candidatus Competibacteraceae bacterium]
MSGSRLRWLGVILGILGLALMAWGAWSMPAAFFPAYLVACLYWTEISVGALALLMIHYLTGGAWGDFSRPILRAAAALLPLLALLSIPLGFGLWHLYPWLTPGPELAELVQHKQPYLNVPFFLIRQAAILGVWIILALLLGTWSRERNEPEATRRRRYRWSALGLILYGLTMTVFGIDWIMSLEPTWYSTSFGLIAGVGPLVMALALAGLVKAALLRRRTDLSGEDRSHLQDLGNLLLAGLLLWSYLVFNQFLTIWSENLPDKIHWYLLRRERIWPWIAVALAAFNLLLPFAALLSRRVKRTPGRLLTVAAIVLLGQALSVYWQVIPSFGLHYTEFFWLDLAAWVGIGGIWLVLFSWLLSRQSPAPAPLAPEPRVRIQSVSEVGVRS